MLLTYLSGGTHARSVAALISVVAPKCRTTPEQLAEAIGALRAEDSPAAGHVLRDLCSTLTPPRTSSCGSPRRTT
jgi:hypothetical protein